MHTAQTSEMKRWSDGEAEEDDDSGGGQQQQKHYTQPGEKRPFHIFQFSSSHVRDGTYSEAHRNE